jgi:5-methylcytosine-specific restriction endonuclease McrA
MSPVKPCCDCKKLVPLGAIRCAKCARLKQRKYDKARGSAAARGYGPTWRRIRAEFLAAHPWCVKCDEPASEVHHIKSIRAGGTHEPSNLVQLCKRHHSQLTAREDGGFGN